MKVEYGDIWKYRQLPRAKARGLEYRRIVVKEETRLLPGLKSRAPAAGVFCGVLKSKGVVDYITKRSDR
jgi:hypothetical protein